MIEIRPPREENRWEDLQDPFKYSDGSIDAAAGIMNGNLSKHDGIQQLSEEKNRGTNTKQNIRRRATKRTLRHVSQREPEPLTPDLLKIAEKYHLLMGNHYSEPPHSLFI
eukprot:CFRG4170T1